MAELAPLTSRYCSSCGAVFSVGVEEEKILGEHCGLPTRRVPTFEGDVKSRQSQYRHFLGLTGRSEAA